MKKLLIIFSVLFFSHQLVYANSFSLFGGSYDYDDDNTTNLLGFNYHLSNSSFNLLDAVILIIGYNILGGIFSRSNSIYRSIASSS